MQVGRITQLTTDDAEKVRAAQIDSATLTAVIILLDDLKALTDWMREPDHVENASLEWVSDWINRRPLSILYRAAPPPLTYLES